MELKVHNSTEFIVYSIHKNLTDLFGGVRHCQVHCFQSSHRITHIVVNGAIKSAHSQGSLTIL